MIHKTPISDMSHEEWLCERRKSLGGSDMGAVLGLNKYRSPYAVWAEKVGLIPGEPDNEAMRQGRDLEAYVVQRFEEKSGKTAQRMNYLLRNDEAPYLHANIDRRIMGEKAGLECKTASALSLKSYSSGDFPESYYVQCVTYLAVTGWDRWYLSALVLNKAFYIYQLTTIQNDICPEWCESSVYVPREEIDALKQSAKNFWELHVITHEPPTLDGAESTTETMETIYADSDSGSIELFGRDAMFRDYEELQTEKCEINRRIEAIKQTFMQDMGEAERASCGNFIVLWTPQSRSTFDVKSFSKDHPDLDLSQYYKISKFRRFSIKEDKGA